ncbi:hypothetical protein LINPERPRIM_LOCUS30307, partial [Linum perenne]
MDYISGDVPQGVPTDFSQDPTMLWGDSERHCAGPIYDAQGSQA